MIHANRGRRVSLARHIAGFTLIELMIVVVVIAILAAIAYPSYQQHVIKARRAAVAGCLQQGAQLMERYYTTNLTYVGAPAPSCEAALTNFYTVGFQGGAPTARAFILGAVPTAIQKDSKCGTLSINAQGVRTKSGSATVAECW
ncbi:pilus assembly protein PilE [Stenotrophomonas sp. KCTC 12332]|nr:pilus assembly protein PilE [Stenotrophomonas sp. KCTC 12332]